MSGKVTACLVILVVILLAGCDSKKFESIPSLNAGTLSSELARDWGLKFDEPGEVTPAAGGKAWHSIHGEARDPSTGATVVCEIGYYAPDEVWSVGFYVQWDDVPAPVEVNSLSRLSQRYFTYCLGTGCVDLANTTQANLIPCVGEEDTSLKNTINGTSVEAWSSTKLCAAAVELVRKSTSDTTGD